MENKNRVRIEMKSKVNERRPRIKRIKRKI